MANEKIPVVWDDTTKKHRPLGTGEKMDGLSASSMISADSGNLLQQGSDGLMLLTGGSMPDPRADNFLEASENGKLQVTSGRMAEWFGSHPQAAAAFADAINVVSDDSGNVVVEGTDKGAYLSKAGLSNAIGSMTDAQLQALAAAIADGQTIVASGGKLIVDPTNATAAKLKKITAVLPKDQGGIVADSSTGKLYVDFDAMSADTKRNIVLSMVDLDGGLAVHDSGAKKGTIYVDFTSMDPAIMRAVVLNMVQQGGGLAVDQNGQLYVDFTTMPDDKFQQLKDSLDMQRTLSENMSVYVDYDHSAASDSYKVRDPESGQLVIDGDRGKETKPFKTISGAVNCVTKVYALGSRNVYIYVKPRFNSQADDYPYYKETVTLPTFTATSGAITIRAFDDGDPPKLCNPSAASGIFRCTGGTWYLRRLDIDNTVSAAGSGQHLSSCVTVGNGGAVYLQGMDLDLRFSGAHDGGYYNLRVISVSNYGRVTISMLSGYQTKLSYDIGNADVLTVLQASNVGSIQIQSSDIADISGISDPRDSIYAILCTGTASTFASVSTQSLISSISGSSYYPRFVYGGSDSPAGKRYDVSTGSGIQVSRLSSAEAGTAFPGGTAGTTDTDTYSWYKENAVSAIPYSS